MISKSKLIKIQIIYLQFKEVQQQSKDDFQSTTINSTIVVPFQKFATDGTGVDDDELDFSLSNPLEVSIDVYDRSVIMIMCTSVLRSLFKYMLYISFYICVYIQVSI